MKKTVTTLMLAFALAAAARAQGADGGVRAALTALPDSQAVLYVNARRITNDALPRVVPAAQLDKFFGELRKEVNVDLRSVEYVVLVARYDVNSFDASAVPDFGVAVRGGFNADALLSVLRLARPAQYRAETHGDKRIDIYTIPFEAPKTEAGAEAALVPEPAKPQPMKLPTELAVVSLGPDELLAGTPSYVRAVIDARGGGAGARIRADLVDLALQNPDALVSLTGDLPPNLSKLFDTAAGAAGQSDVAAGLMNDEIRRLADSLRQLQLSLSMTPAEFGLQTTLRTERPEDARALSGLVDFGVNALEQGIRKDLVGKSAKSRASAQKVLALVRSLVNTTRDSDLTLSLSVAQATVADFVNQITAPPTPQKRAAPQRRGRARTATRRRA